MKKIAQISICSIVLRCQHAYLAHYYTKFQHKQEQNNYLQGNMWCWIFLSPCYIKLLIQAMC